MPSRLDKLSQLIHWPGMGSTGFHRQGALTSNMTFADGLALKPILPPSVPFSGVSAAEALACPPVSKAVDLFTTAFMRLQWQAAPATLAWLERPTGQVSAEIRNARTLQDIFFHNRALWVLDRRADGIYSAAHLPVEFWGFNEDGQLAINGVALSDDMKPWVIYFPGAKPLPFLEIAKVTLQHYKALAQTTLDRSESPIALMELALQDEFMGAQPGDEDYDADEDPVLAAQRGYAAARGTKGGAVTVTPRNVKLNVHQIDDDGAMLINARDAVRKDVANFANVPVSLLDGEGGSKDYSNTLQNRNEFLELGLGLFTMPITTRLSMDDVTPAGTTVELNLPTFDAAPQDGAGNTQEAVGTLQDAANAGLS